MSYEAFSKGETAEPTDPAPVDWDTLPDLEPSPPTSEPSSWWQGKRGTFLGLGAGIVIGLGVAIAAGLGQKPATQSAGKPVAAPPPGQSVTVAEVETGQVAHTISATGTVAAYDLLPILPERTGLQIEQVLVDEGDRVIAGQVLAVLDDSVLQAELSQAQAQLASAQAVVRQRQAALKQAQATSTEARNNLRRYQSLASQGAISQQDLETRTTTATTAQEAIGVAQANISSAEADVQSSMARVQQLETQLAQTKVTAPASGIVAERGARVGDVTSSSQKLFSLIRNGFLELQVKVPETQLSQVHTGAPVRITSDADPQIQVTGYVRDIAPLVDPQTRQATIKIDLPTSDRLRPGMFLRAEITDKTIPGMIVPAKAVLPQAEGKAIVYVVDPTSTVHAQTVEVGARQNAANADAAHIEILQGLHTGDRVVVAGAGYLKDGDRVEVVDRPVGSSAPITNIPARK